MKLSPLEWIALGGLGIVVFIAYQKGLFSKNVQAQINPTTATGGLAPLLTPAEHENIVNNIVNAVNENTAMLNPDPLYNALIPLTSSAAKPINDADFIAVFNNYARRNVNSEYKNLSSFLNSEYVWWDTATWNTRNAIIQYAQKFNL